MVRHFIACGLISAVLLVVQTAAAQMPEAKDFLERCQSDRDRAGGQSREQFCEVRNFSLAATGELRVDAGQNGGITVQGWDRAQVYVLALISTRAPTAEQAQEMAAAVRVLTDGAVVRTEGPQPGPWSTWSVGYRVFVPRRTALSVEAHNGGIKLADVAGRSRFSTLNGGITLERVAGDVRGRTTNGGVEVRLDGDRWRGEGLEVETTNGAVTLRIPTQYSALLAASTVNGTLTTDIPLTVQGNIGRRISARLGQGGAPIRVSTTNGSVRIATTTGSER